MTILASESKCHLVMVPLQAWGHARPLTALAARIAQTKPIIITFFTPKNLYHRIDTELSRSFSPEQNFVRARIRLVALSCDEDNPLDIKVFYDSFEHACNKLIKEEPISCAHTGTSMDRVRAPDAAILDIFAYAAFNYLRALNHTKIKLYCYTPCAAFATYRLIFKSASLLEQGAVRGQLEREAAESGRTLAEVAKETFLDMKGIVDRIPGLPPMYDYENYPQEVVLKTPLDATIHLSFIEHLALSDGIIVSSPACIDTFDGVAGLSNWLAKSSRRFYAVGPLLPPEKPHAIEQEKKLSADAMEIDLFMEKILQAQGAKAMIFMSFGSLFWPADPTKVWAFIDVLLDRHIPFIFSHGAQTAAIPDHVTERVHNSGMGFLTSWAPQQAILTHPVTGWFVTHAGFNSMMESVTAGVPMICWPYRAEQPLNSMHMTDNLDIAYELFEVRTGEHAHKPVYRTGRAPVGTLDALREEAIEVLEKAFGGDGKRKQANVMKLREETLAAWAEEGTSRQAVESLVAAFHA